jgi:hypothetical protein
LTAKEHALNKTSGFDAIQKHPYVNWGTYKKNGEKIATPVWFACQDGKAYIWSQRDTFKVKRVLNNNRCDLTPCNFNGKKNLGPTLAGVARLVERSEVAAIKKLFRQKYGLQFSVFEFLGRYKPGSDHVYFEISPAQN